MVEKVIFIYILVNKYTVFVFLLFLLRFKETLMTKIEEIESAVDSLPELDYRKFRHWFLERDWEAWENKLAIDEKSGKLDFLIEEAANRSARKLFQE